MTAYIQITTVPPGGAPANIREAWVGVKIPLASEQDAGEEKYWSGRDNASGYVVSTSDAIAALRAAGKTEAACFWEEVRLQTGHQLRFGAGCCKVVNE